MIDDYKEFVAKNPDLVNMNLDKKGREKRFVDFHHISKNAEALGNSEKIMKILDFIFGNEAGIYTSLTFKYGTEQPVHRDTPHFATNPESYFCGVWTALEDINPEAGPIFYYKAANRFENNPSKFMKMALDNYPNEHLKDQLLKALDLYNGFVIDQSKNFGPAVVPELKAGDTVIWHAQTPHGGMPVLRDDLTRWSIVFHCAPIALQVYQHDQFFGSVAGKYEPDKRYGFREVGGRKIAVAGVGSYM